VTALPLALCLLAAAPSALEDRAMRAVALDFERVGRRTPTRDEALSEAARILAQRALDHDARSAADLVALTAAVSRAGGWDPSPRALVVRGAPSDEPVKSLEKRKDLASDPATHVGVGVAVKGHTAALVVLLSHRKMTLQPFARAFDAPTSPQALCGRLEVPYAHPELFVTLPDGKVQKLRAPRRTKDGYCAEVPLRTRGRYTVEVLARGSKGPEVAALFFVDVGPPPADGQSPLGEEPSDVETARAEILARVNALRAAHGQPPLALDAEATRVAQAYSDRMARENFFAHLSPDGQSVSHRLRAGKVPFQSAGENLGMAAGPLAAHFGLEHSPGHRQNLLEAKWTRLGLGVARTTSEGGTTLVLLTQIFVEPPPSSGDPLEAAYRVLADRRRALSLPPLERSAALEGLAREHARKALAAGEPTAELPGAKLHERVFDTLDDVKSAAVDFFVADSPAQIEASKSAAQAGNPLVGIGAVQGDSRRYGQGKYWVVVIYAQKR
jgi:uncharacterized protein YkwD